MSDDLTLDEYGRVSAADVAVGDRVKVVNHGPVGEVVTTGEHWVTVRYPGGRDSDDIPYRLSEHLHLVERPAPRPATTRSDVLELSRIHTQLAAARTAMLDASSGYLAVMADPERPAHGDFHDLYQAVVNANSWLLRGLAEASGLLGEAVTAE